MMRVGPFLAVLISLVLAFGPATDRFGAAQDGLNLSLATAMSDNSGANGSDMPDCMKLMGGPDRSSCPCCDTKSKCLTPTGCLMTCCKVLGVPPSMPRGAGMVTRVTYYADAPDKPPDFGIKPPAPPPRA